MNTAQSSNRGNALATVRITDEASFLDLRHAWNQLVAERSVFLRHEWFDAAWQWRRQDRAVRLAIVCFYRDARLVGVCPLIEHSVGAVGFTHRVLAFLTVPDTQLCDIIVDATEEGAVAEALATELANSRSEWDILQLAYLPQSAFVIREFTSALRRRGVTCAVLGAGGNPYVSLKTTWDNYYSTRSRSLKKANNLAANRLRKAGNINIDWLYSGCPTTVDASTALEAAIDISAASWKRSTSNSLDNAGPQAFIRRLSERALEKGWLSIWVLALNGRPMAMEYQLIFDGSVHALRSDFVEGNAEISPGTYLNRCLLERLFGHGLHRYLMGPGDNPYKVRWMESAAPLFRLEAYSPSARGRVAAFWDLRIKPALRAIKATMKRMTEAEAR